MYDDLNDCLDAPVRRAQNAAKRRALLDCQQLLQLAVDEETITVTSVREWSTWRMSSRLRWLHARGLLSVDRTAAGPSRSVYRLTPKGVTATELSVEELEDLELDD